MTEQKTRPVGCGGFVQPEEMQPAPEPVLSALGVIRHLSDAICSTGERLSNAPLQRVGNAGFTFAVRLESSHTAHLIDLRKRLLKAIIDGVETLDGVSVELLRLLIEDEVHHG